MIQKILFWQGYDLDATTYKFGRYLPSAPSQGMALSSAGTSTTVEAALAGIGTFASLAAGSVLWFKTSPTATTVRKIVTAGFDSCIVDSTIDLGTAGVPFSFRQFLIGAADTDGWANVKGFESKTLFVQIPTVSAAGGIDLTIEGLGEDVSTPMTLLTKNYAAAAEETIDIPETILSLRVGLKGGSGFAGTDDITVYLEGAFRSVANLN